MIKEKDMVYAFRQTYLVSRTVAQKEYFRSPPRLRIQAARNPLLLSSPDKLQSALEADFGYFIVGQFAALAGKECDVYREYDAQ